MLKRYHQSVGLAWRFLDAAVIALVWVSAYALRLLADRFELFTQTLPSWSTYLSLLPVIVLLWAAVLSAAGAYRPTVLMRRTEEAWLLVRGHALAVLALIALTYVFSDYRYSRSIMGVFAVTGGFALVTSRLLLRNWLRRLSQRGFLQKKLLLLGEGQALARLLERIGRFPELGYRPIGLLGRAPELASLRSLRHFGDLSQLENVLKNERPEALVIALPRTHTDALDDLLRRLKDETLDIHLLPDLEEYLVLGCEVDSFDGQPIVNLNDSPLQGWGAAAKRATDLVGSSIGLLALSVPLALIALAVRLTSRGPILYGQERMGIDGRTFQMLKFRSMKVDAEAATGAVWAQQADDRRTPIGAFLRSTSLDELPQLWNVLRGEMSLVGPRPERPVFVEKFRHEIPNYMLRHKVRAGITGWAQVNGLRGNTSLEDRIAHDLFYIRNWSYLFDIRILFLTLWKGFVHKNAY